MSKGEEASGAEREKIPPCFPPHMPAKGKEGIGLQIEQY